MGDTVNSYENNARKLKAMGHPVRLQILDILRCGEVCVCHIEHALNKRQSYISQHLMTLRDAGFVSSRKDGLQVYYCLADEQVTDLLYLLHGALEIDALEVLEECNCPTCSTVPIT